MLPRAFRRDKLISTLVVGGDLPIPLHSTFVPSCVSLFSEFRLIAQSKSFNPVPASACRIIPRDKTIQTPQMLGCGMRG